MPRKRQASKRRSRKEVVPVLGAVSLSLTGAASAGTAPTMDVPTNDKPPAPEWMLSEEEVADVSLGTFYVFDKETAGVPRLEQRFARACRGCGGCRGCRGCARACRGCAGCAGCAGCGGCGGGCGCCWSWGACRVC